MICIYKPSKKTGDLKAFREAIIKFKSDPVNKFYNVEEEINGIGYMNKGEKELTVRFYKRLLELNPENQNAAEMLKNLTGGN